MSLAIAFHTPAWAQDPTPGDSGAVQRSVVGSALERRIANLKSGEDSVVIDDMRFKIDRRAKGAAAFRIARWPKGVVYYAFDESIDDVLKKKIEAALKEWSSAAPVRFVKRKKQDDYVLFANDGTGSNWSWVGVKGGAQKLNLSSTAPYGTVLHEIAHALGFRHEQARSDRDRYIQVIRQNIKPDASHNFDIEPGINCTPYDFASVMHYPSTAASINGDVTIAVRPQYAHYQGVLGQRVGLTEMDKLAMRKLYTDPTCDPSKLQTSAINSPPVAVLPQPSKYAPSENESPRGSVAGLHAGAFLHASEFEFEGDGYKWTGDGYGVRGAIGVGNFLVLHGSLQWSMLSPGEGASEAEQGTIWDFNDQEVGARAYLLGKGSFIRPYAQGAYSFRNIKVTSDTGVRGNAVAYGGGAEIFVVPGLSLEVNATFADGVYTHAYNGDSDATFEELGLAEVKGTHRRISAGAVWHIN